MGKKGKGKGKGTKPCGTDYKHVWRYGALVRFAVTVALCIAAVGCTTLKDFVWPTTVKCLTTPASALVAEVTAIVEALSADCNEPGGSRMLPRG